MSERKLQIQVGILFIASVAILIAGVLWFKEFTIGGHNYEVVVEFPQTSGLVKGDPVDVKGVRSGKVEDIEFKYGQALVTVSLERSVVLRHGTVVSISNVGLMGQKVVNIWPGRIAEDTIPEGTVLRGVYEAGIPEILGGMGGVLDTFESLAARVDSLLASLDDSRQQQLLNTLSNVERATGELADLLEGNREDLNASIRSMRTAMGELSTMMEGRGATFGQTLEDASSAMARLDTTLTILDTTVSRMDKLLARVEGGEGTLGHLVQDQDLYDELVLTLRDAKALLYDVRQNPKRYFKFSIF
jgi:phospholipid/cholesterol/gamma-HCH transport system substrate-binding protein